MKLNNHRRYLLEFIAFHMEKIALDASRKIRDGFKSSSIKRKEASGYEAYELMNTLINMVNKAGEDAKIGAEIELTAHPVKKTTD